MEVPAQIGKYEIIGLIGRGGMGVVYQARDNALGRLVALKVMTNDLALDAEVHIRFLREARSVAALQHPNIVVVYELSEHNGSPFIAMEFLDGKPLDQVIRNHVSLSVPQKIDIILEVAKALQYAHDKGVIHRDVKPGNIMRLRDGSVKVVDFGIAHLADQTITKTGMVMGTLGYLAPEQLNGEGIDRRTDIFSLGVVLYELLSGRLPFEGSKPAEVIKKILLEAPAPLPSTGDANLPELQPIVYKALTKRKEQRYQTCSEFADALTRLRKKLEVQSQLATQGEERKALPVQLDGQHIADAAPAVRRQKARAPKQIPRQVSSGRHSEQRIVLGMTPQFRRRLWLSGVVIAMMIVTGAYIALFRLGTSKTNSSPAITQPESSSVSTSVPTNSNVTPSPPSEITSSAETEPAPKSAALGSLDVRSSPTSRHDREPTSLTGDATPSSTTARVNMESTIGDLGVMSGLIAHSSSELEILKQKGDRNYYDFTLHKGAVARVSTVGFQLEKVDPKKGRFTLNVIADDRTIEKKDRGLNEPLQFYTGREHMLYEVVVFSADKNSVTGYLATPKNPSAPVPTSLTRELTPSSTTAPVNMLPTIGDLGLQSLPIAVTRDELEISKQKGDRNYYNFTLRKDAKTPVSTISLQLKELNLEKRTFTLYVIADDRTIEKKDRGLNKPLQFYTGRDHMLYEIVVNSIEPDSVTGYLSTPKVAPLPVTP
jgi:serine/threonine protein kinase